LNFEAAIIAATISILIGGMLFGIGIGFGARRIRLLGAEEIGQGIISAAMVGALISFSILLNSATSELLPTSLPACPHVPNPSASPHLAYACYLSSIEEVFSHLGLSLSRSAQITGFASSLKVSVGSVSAQPLFALEDASRQLSAISASANSLSAIAVFERALATFIQSSALTVFLPAGLLLRCFFATRKVGAAAMAIAISAYAIFPLFFLYALPNSQTAQAASAAVDATDGFNSDFASVPLLNLDETSAVRDRLNEMSSGDFPGKLQPILSLSSNAAHLAFLDLVLFPMLSLAISIVAALEFYRLLSAPILLPFFSSI
jgi:hypothetical protein